MSLTKEEFYPFYAYLGLNIRLYVQPSNYDCQRKLINQHILFFKCGHFLLRKMNMKPEKPGYSKKKNKNHLTTLEGTHPPKSSPLREKLHNRDTTQKYFFVKCTHFSSGCSSLTEQTSVSHLTGQTDPYSMFPASLIYMKLQGTIIQSQILDWSSKHGACCSVFSWLVI